MSSVNRAGPVTGTFSEKFQPGLRDEERPKILGTSSARSSRNKANMSKHKIITFAPIIPLATLIAESLG